MSLMANVLGYTWRVFGIHMEGLDADLDQIQNTITVSPWAAPIRDQ